MSLQPFGVTINIGDPGGDNRRIWAFTAPSDANGGAVRLLSANAVSTTSVINSLGVGGTTFTLALHKYNTAGTPAVNGTIAAAIGGTTVGWTADVPQAFTIDDDYSALDAGERLAIQYNEVNTGNPVQVQVNLLFGVGR